MEHRFITPSDGFIRAIAICRQRLLDCSAETVIGALLNRTVKQNGNVEAGVTQVGINCKYIQYTTSTIPIAGKKYFLLLVEDILKLRGKNSMRTKEEIVSQSECFNYLFNQCSDIVSIYLFCIIISRCLLCDPRCLQN